MPLLHIVINFCVTHVTLKLKYYINYVHTLYNAKKLSIEKRCLVSPKKMLNNSNNQILIFLLLKLKIQDVTSKNLLSSIW